MTKQRHEMLDVAAKRLAVIRPQCHEGEVLEAMLNAKKGRTSAPATADLRATMQTKLDRLRPIMNEGAELSAMIDAALSAVGFADPTPCSFEVPVPAGQKISHCLQFIAPVRAYTFSIDREEAEAFEVQDMRYGLCSSILSNIPVRATELTGEMPLNLVHPEEGVFIGTGLPTVVAVKNISDKNAILRITFRVKCMLDDPRG